MLVAPAMGPTMVRSSMEVMLETIRQRDGKPKDSMPALPARPVSKGRLPSSRRFVLVNFPIEEEVTLTGGGAKKIGKVEKPEESPTDWMAGIVSNGKISVADAEVFDGSGIDHVPRKESNEGQVHMQTTCLDELQMRVMEVEATLRQKEEENLTLKQRLQQYESKWSDYEDKMKSMEEKWQKQMASLQTSLAAAKNLAADDMVNLPGRLDPSLDRQCFDSENTCLQFRTPESTPAKQPHGFGSRLSRNTDDTQNPVSRIVKEFKRKKQAIECDAKFLIAEKSGQLISATNPDEELQKLKARFAVWRKDYKVKLQETKIALQNLENSEAGKMTRKRWWMMRSKK